jgi:arylformamidase
LAKAKKGTTNVTYRDMDRPTLDREYNARATAPNFAELMAAYRARTDIARATLPCTLDIPYGPTARERLDVFPTTVANAPVLLFIHGGYWKFLDTADSGFMAPAFTAAGVCVVVVDYALAPAVTLDEIVRQCRAALAWVHGHIAAHGGDPSRIHVAGSSAGGHLAAMLAAGGDWMADFGLPPRPVAGATLLSGLFELEPLRLCDVNGWLSLDAAAVARNSPARLPPPAAGLPVILSVAATETSEFKRQTLEYAGFCTAAGCATHLVPAPAKSNHFDIVFELCDASTPLSRAILGVMQE